MKLGRSLRAWTRRPIRVWSHRAFRVPVAPHGTAMLDPRRSDDALTWALDAGVLSPDDVEEAPEIGWGDVLRVHDPAYLASLDRTAALSRILAVPEEMIPVSGILELWRRACGGVLAGARWSLANKSPALCLSGGFHHAEPAKGGGFCGINDVAIAIAALRTEGLRGMIAVIDLDAHPPDGTVACLASDTETSILSVSVQSHWSVPEGPRVLDRRVPSGAGDEVYLEAVDRILAALPTRCAMVFYLAGTDPLAGDPLGGLAVSEAGLRERDRRVFRQLRGVPSVTMPAGGYTERSWRVLANTLAEAAQLGTVPAMDYDPLARRTRYVARRLDPAVLSGDENDVITEADLFGDLSIGRARDERFLGYYTRHGLEHALTEHGFLPALRAMGFEQLQLHLEPSEAQDRLRISARVGAGRADLVDLCLSLRTMGGFRVLFVEWLEMLDPRSLFVTSRPRLPGQRAPGLGLAPEVGHLLVISATRLGLDGVGLVPAHYHVAWMSRHRFEVLDPEERGRFRALVHHLRDVPLGIATQQLHQGLVTEDGELLRWWSPQMAIPLSESMRTWVASTEGRARKAESSWRGRLVPIPPGEWGTPAT